MAEISEDAGNRVHFKEAEDGFSHESRILVEKSRKNRILVHLGFLSINHKYKIQFLLPEELIKFSKSLTLKSEQPSLCVKNFEQNIEPNGIAIAIEFFAYKEKLLKETVQLEMDMGSEKENLEMILQARVLGKGKGTPSLREGIRVIEFIDVDESEQSDWQGFE